ncbi:hypothetical protein ACEWY4_022238 [Coilia grayii]|uniref:Lebercilin domain-containing protein n=1 Tax=Coilia grayii TaxID=363190 RepID=A0ABD1J7A6_9TELE
MNRKEGESMNSQGVIPDHSMDNRDREQSQLSLRSIGKESERSIRSRGKRAKPWEDADRSPRDHSYERDRESECSRTRTKESAHTDRDQERDPDRDRLSDQDRDQDGLSDGERSSGSFYSDDYEKLSRSERSLSPETLLGSPRRPARARRVSSSPLHRAGPRKGPSRPLRPGPPHHHPHHHHHAPQRWGGSSMGGGGGGRRGVGGVVDPPSQRSCSQSKEGVGSGPGRDLDLVSKRLLSARLLKIQELKNALAELQHTNQQLAQDNRLLRQLQLRHEKALNRYSDTESEIGQLLARHAGETAALKERVRRGQERQRAAERGQREADERLQRSERQLRRLQRLAQDQQLGEREELARRLEASQQRAQESERKAKELERNMELSSGSYQRQLAGERRRTHEAQEEVRSLQEEVQRLTLKLKEKERELDARNIYSNRMLKPAPKRDTDRDSVAKKKVPSRSSSKAVQTEEKALSLDFPSPPPAITDGSDLTDHRSDDYLSLKELQNGDQSPREIHGTRNGGQERQSGKEQWRERMKKEREEKERGRREKEKLDQELSSLEEKAKRLTDDKLGPPPHAVTPSDAPSVKEDGPGPGPSSVYDCKYWEKEDNARKKHSPPILHKEEENRKRRGFTQEDEVKAKDTGGPTATAANQQRAEEESRQKQQLLAKMREIDQQAQGGDPDRFFSDPAGEPASEARSSSRVSEPRNQNASIFSFTEPAESVSLWGGPEPAGGGEGATGARKGVGGALRGSQKPSEEDSLLFGGYAPSFGRPAQRASLTSSSSTSFTSSTSASRTRPEIGPKPVLDAGLDLGMVKERKSNLLQQLFGSAADPASPSASSSSTAPSKMEVLSATHASQPDTSATATGRRRDTEVSPSNSGRTFPGTRNTLHVTESRPAVRAIASFDDDIEELTL